MIAARLEEVRARIRRSATAAGRDPESVKLVAVSKTQTPQSIRSAYDAGQRAFGENYAQELAAKAAQLGDLDGIEWHFVGHLQTNKVKLVAGRVSCVHTVDSAALARELGKRVARENRERVPVLIEVNVSGEPQKAGASPGEIASVMDAVVAQPGLALRGLMTMPPAGSLELARRTFETLATLRSLHGGEKALPELSMGMSEDFEVAIQCGATFVRVGSAIFGARNAVVRSG